MRDLAVLAILMACVGLAFFRPWVGVLALAFFAYMHPQGFAPGLMHDFPAYKVLFAATVGGMLIFRQWRPIPIDWRLFVLLGLWALFLATTITAKAAWAAWPRMAEISKIFLAMLLTLVLIDSRQKLFTLIVVIAASFALVTIKGGYWAVMTGFADRVYGPPDSQYYDNNMFAIAALMNVPLLVLWLRETQSRRLRYGLAAVIGLSIAAALSSWSRGALITLAVTCVVLLWQGKRSYRLAPLVIVGLVLAFVMLPEAWFERMQSIVAYQHDSSAQSRLDVWQVGIAHALLFPLTGVGFDGWHYAVVTMDWHNSYVEMMAEHGFVGLALWCTLIFGTVASLMRLGRKVAAFPELAWVGRTSGALIASLIAYAAGSLFLGLSYWDLLYHLIVIAILLEGLARTALSDRRATMDSTRVVPPEGQGSYL